MQLPVGALSYILVVAALVAGAAVGISAIVPREEALLVSAKSAGAPTVRTREEYKSDPNRVPVWIAPTTKYQYEAPKHTEQKKRPQFTISREAARSSAKKQEARRAIAAALGDNRSEMSGRRLGYSAGNRDNNPFYRD